MTGEARITAHVLVATTSKAVWVYADSTVRTEEGLLEYTLRSMTKPFRLALSLVFLSAVVDLIGFLFGLFYAGFLYDNLAHFPDDLFARGPRHGAVTSGTAARYLRVTAVRVLLAGAVLGIAGGVAWEVFEAGLGFLLPPGMIYNPPLDSVVDTAFGTLGGALGTLVAVRHLSRTLASYQPPEVYDKKTDPTFRSGVEPRFLRGSDQLSSRSPSNFGPACESAALQLE